MTTIQKSPASAKLRSPYRYIGIARSVFTVLTPDFHLALFLAISLPPPTESAFLSRRGGAVNARLMLYMCSRGPGTGVREIEIFVSACERPSDFIKCLPPTRLLLCFSVFFFFLL